MVLWFYFLWKSGKLYTFPMDLEEKKNVRKKGGVGGGVRGMTKDYRGRALECQ